MVGRVVEGRGWVGTIQGVDIVVACTHLSWEIGVLMRRGGFQ